MQFFIDNANLFLIFISFVAIFIATFIAIPYAQRKGWLSSSNLEAAHKALEMATLALGSLSIGAGIAGKTALILKATEAAVGYVEQTMKLENNTEKRLHAQETTIRFLEQEGIEISDDLRKLIEVGLQSAVNKLPKTYP